MPTYCGCYSSPNPRETREDRGNIPTISPVQNSSVYFVGLVITAGLCAQRLQATK